MRNVKICLKFMNIMVVFCLCFVILPVRTGHCSVLEDTSCGYTLQYPADWQVQTFSNSKDLVKAEINKDEETGIQVRIYHNDKKNFRAFADWYIDDFRKQMIDHWGGTMDPVDEQYIYIARKKCCVFSFDFKRKDGRAFFLKQYLFPHQKDVFVIQSGMSSEWKKFIEPVMDSIADSFEFID